MDAERFLILETLPTGVSPRQKILQMSKARSHASTVGRRRAMDEREALSIGPKHSEPRPKPRIAWSGAYRIGPSPQHALRHLPKATTNEEFKVIRSPRPSHIDIAQSVPKLSTIPGSPRPRNGKQTTGDQQARSLENDSILSHNTVSNTAKNPTSSSGSSSPASFQLVHYDPLKKTTAESIHAVRSNAVRYQWKRSKAVRPRGRKTKVPETTDSPSQQAGTSRKDQTVHANKPGQTVIKSRTIPDKNRRLVKLPSPGNDSSLQPGGYPTELPSGSVAPLYHLVYEVTNRTFIGNQVKAMNVMATRYVQQMRSHPASFHAAVWVCAKGMIDRSSTNPSVRKHTRLLDLCHNIAVKSVIQMITDLSDPNYLAPYNALGMLCSAMQSLALGTTEDVILRKPQSGPKQSTLTKLQNLNLFGMMPRWLNYHEEAARKILDTNQNMGPFWAGLRICQTQNDIISSCRTLTKPRSPCAFLNPDFPDLYNQVKIQLQPKHSPGFMKYAATLSPALSGPLLSTISQLSSYDTIQAALLSNRLSWFGIEGVCDARNWTQHQLMSLPSNGDLPILTSDMEDAIMFDAVRHALIVYSLIAAFPLPLPTAPFPELASRLEAGILQVLEDDQNTISTLLLLWTSTMAALAAIGTSQRTSLVAICAGFCRKLRISSWESMQAILQDYLWSGDISDFDGMYLFLEIGRLVLQEDDESLWVEE